MNMLPIVHNQKHVASDLKRWLFLQGFYCGTEAAFDDWTHAIYKPVAHGQHTPIFEVVRERPAHFPPFEPYTPQASGAGKYILGNLIGYNVHARVYKNQALPVYGPKKIGIP